MEIGIGRERCVGSAVLCRVLNSSSKGEAAASLLFNCNEGPAADGDYES